MKSLKRPVAAFLAALTLFGAMVSCQRQQDEVVPASENIKVEKQELTPEEEAFLAELDQVIACELKKSEQSEMANKGNNVIDPSNPNNPYEYIGKEIQAIFECAEPHMKEAINENVEECSIKEGNNCGKTGECVCHGPETNIKMLLISCTKEISGVSVNPYVIPSISELETNYNVFDLVENSDLSYFGKKIAHKYFQMTERLNTYNSFVNVSIGFENLLIESKLLIQQDKEGIMPIVTSNKYVISYVNNNFENPDPLFKGLVGCLAVASAAASVGAVAWGTAFFGPVGGITVLAGACAFGALV